MEATATDNGRTPRGEFKAFKNEARDAGRKAKAAGSQEIHSLFADVEDLMSRLANTVDPEISRIRAKVESGLADARDAFSEGSEQLQRQARDAVKAGGRYVSDNPWMALGAAALTGVTLGILIARR